jgi:tetratricopeptide (TPR) repeat protein
MTRGLAFLMLFILTAPASWAGPEIDRMMEEGDALFENVSEENCLKAADLYRRATELEPENYEANWRAARAYVCLLDLKTESLIEEKEEYKPVLQELGSKAEFYGARAYAADPKGLDGLVWYTGGYSYHAASMGIVKAILKGAGGTLKRLAKELIALDDTYHGAFGYRMLGRFHIVAPFPAGSKSKAVENLELAVRKDPSELQNHYWLGEAYSIKKKYKEAAEQYQYVLDNPPNKIEEHIDAAFKKASRKRLAALKAEGKIS